jgi:hypothetical protein
MGAVKRQYENVTYALMIYCSIEDDKEGKNYGAVFNWVMENYGKAKTVEDLAKLYKKEKKI